MSQLPRNLLRALTAFVLAFALPLAARAQGNDKPVLIVAVNKMSELLGDIGMVSELTGQADAGKVVVGMAGIYTNGIDKTKPAGAYVTLSNSGPKVIGFIPVTNLKAMLATFRERIGTPKDIGKGVLEIGADRQQSMFVKEQSGWAFIAQDAANLAGLPDNPATMLEGLDQQYDIAVRVNVQNIPAEFRDMVVSQLKVGFDQAMRTNARNLGPDERKTAESVARGMLQGVVDFVEQADQVTIGFAVDAKTKGMFLETSSTAKAGSDLAKQMAGLNGVTTRFGGLTAGNPAAQLSLALPLSKADVDQLTQLFQAGRESALREIDNDANIPDQKTRTNIKSTISDLIDILSATVQKGKLDAAAAVHVGEQSIHLVAGGFIADGLKLESSVKRAIEIVKSLPNVPNIDIDASSHKGVNLHKIDVPIDDPNASKLLGDRAQLVLGFGKESAFLAFGQDALNLLKKGIDSSDVTAPKPLGPLHAKIVLSPILNLAAKVDGNPQAQLLAAAAQKSDGNDHIQITVRAIERGSATRIEIGSGVFQIGGEAAKAAQGGR